MAGRSGAFGDLSDAERKVVGSEGDYDWDRAVRLPARERPDMTQVSLRLDRELYESVQRLAEAQGVSFSDMARSALRGFAIGGQAGWNPVITYGFPRLLLTVSGHVAEMPASRRYQQPDERIDISDVPDVLTAASG